MKQSSIFVCSTAIALAHAGAPLVAWGDSPSGLEEILVTARRVEENQQAIPVAVTTLTAAALENRNVNSVNDIQFNVPNLQIRPSTIYPTQPEFIIRGQRQVLFTDENVVTYVNNVPQTTRGLTLYDLENVQSLKGPQGTLFGKNSMGGAMVFTTKRPTFETEGQVALEGGNYDLKKATAIVNLPLVNDVAALRVAGQIERRDGVFENSFPGMKDLDDRHNASGRGTLLLKPTDKFENVLTVDYLKRDEIPIPAEIEAAPTNATGFAGLVSILTQQVVTQQSQLGGSTAANNGNLLVRRGDPFRMHALTGIGTTIPGLPISIINTYGSSVLSKGLSNVSTYQFNDNISLKNILGARHERSTDQSDPAGVSGATVDASLVLNCLAGGPTCAGPFPSPFNTQFSNNNVNYFNRLKTISDEVQFIGNFDTFKVIAGGFYSHSNLLYAVNSFFSIGPVSLYDNRATAPTETSRHAQATIVTDSYAVFAQGTYDFSSLGAEGLRATAGVRQTWDKRDYSSENFFSSSTNELQYFSSGIDPLNCNELNGTVNGITSVNDGTHCSISGKRTYKAPTWTISLEYQATPETLVYLASRRGFKAGSPNPTTRLQQYAFFDSEKITDFELGLKHQGYLGPVPYRVNVAGFIGEYKNIQTQDILTFCTDSVACNPAQGTYTDLIVLNLGKATIKGVEVEGSIKPIPDLTLDLGYSYQVGRYGSGSRVPQPTDPTKPIYNSNPIDFTSGTDLDGVEFAGVPRTTFNINAVYEASFIPQTFAKTALSVNYSYRSETKGLSAQGLYQTPSFGLWGGRLAFNNIAESPLSLSIWSQNISNKEYKLRCADNLYSIGYAACYWGEPRTYGITAEYKF